MNFPGFPGESGKPGSGKLPDFPFLSENPLLFHSVPGKTDIPQTAESSLFLPISLPETVFPLFPHLYVSLC